MNIPISLLMLRMAFMKALVKVALAPIFEGENFANSDAALAQRNSTLLSPMVIPPSLQHSRICNAYPANIAIWDDTVRQTFIYL